MIVKNEQDVRAGHTGDGVRYMLAAGIVLAALALLFAMAAFAG